MNDAAALDDAVGANHFRNRCHGAYLRHRQTRPLQLSADRCAAASARPSSAGQNDRLHALLAEVPGDFATQPTRIVDGIGQTGGRHELVEESTNLSRALELTRSVKRYQPIRILSHEAVVVAAVRDFVIGRIESISA